MIATMAKEHNDPPESVERIRLIVDTTELLRRAVKLRAAKEGLTNSEVINRLIREYLAEELEEVEKSLRKKK